MRYRVSFTDSAERDLMEIDAYITQHDSLENSDYVLSQIEEAINSLSELPERGVYPRELSTLGIHEYREIFFKPYRIIYRKIDKTIYIYLIADGHRDIQILLNRRLLDV